MLAKGRLAKLTGDTEQNLVLAPGAFWNHSLRSRLESIVANKLPGDSCRPEETTVTVSVSKRSERDLTKRFDELNIGWAVVEEQLRAWGDLAAEGKKLRIDISFIYRERSQAVTGRTRPIAGRGATATQLAERDTLLESSGRPGVWQDVYRLMQCDGRLCHLGPYYWRDKDARKHYKLDTKILTKLVTYAEEGHPLQTHDDVPPDVRELIYLVEQQDAERRKLKHRASSSGDLPRVNITNVQPSPYHPASAAYYGSPRNESEMAEPIWRPTRISIPGPRDKAIRKYYGWHCAQVTDPNWQAGFRGIGDIIIAEGLDHKRVHAAQEQEIAFLVAKGIKRGIAIHFASNVECWLDEAQRS